MITAHLGALLWGSWFRLACLGWLVVLLAELATRRWLKARRFRQQIDKLPGPPTSSRLLGNIPAKVLSLLLASPSAEPSASAGHSRKPADDFYLSQIQSLLGHTLIYRDKPLFRLWLGAEPVVCVWKAHVVEQVLSDNFLLEKSYHYDFLRPWLGDGLLTSPGKIWRPRRKLLVPSFHFNILRAFVPVFDRKSHLLIRNLKRQLGTKLDSSSAGRRATKLEPAVLAGPSSSVVVDITPVITACTLDAICETIMGVRIDAQASEPESSDNDYCQSIYIVGETFLERIIQPRYWLNWLFRYTELGKLYNYHLAKLHSFTRQVIAEKKRQKLNCGALPDQTVLAPISATSQLASRLKALDQSSVDQFEANNMPTTTAANDEPKLPKAFLDLLLDRVLSGSSAQTQRLSDEQIREEVDTFMFEGHDTTAMALSWTLFLLGHNQDVQCKLQAEVDQLFQLYPELGADETNCAEHTNIGLGLDLDHLKQLKYLDCVIKEALRLCPSVPFIGRKTTSELELAGYTIPAGSVIFVLIYQLHRDSEIFPNPEKFDPDRFLAENTLGRHPFAYVPFSAGPRNCIGQKFAMAEMKTILLHMVRNFSFESVTPMDKARVQMEMVLRPKCPLNIRIKARTGP